MWRGTLVQVIRLPRLDSKMMGIVSCWTIPCGKSNVTRLLMRLSSVGSLPGFFSLTDVPETIVPGVADSDPPVMESGVWFDLIEEKSSEFDYEFGLALTWHPVGKNSSVTIDP